MGTKPIPKESQLIKLGIENITSITLCDKQKKYNLEVYYDDKRTMVPSNGETIFFDLIKGVTLKFELLYSVNNEDTYFTTTEIDLVKSKTGENKTKLVLKDSVGDPDPVTVTIEIEDEIGSGHKS